MTEKKNKKPTGEIGHAYVRGKQVTFVPVAFPTTKPEIERFILDAALAPKAWVHEPGRKQAPSSAPPFDLRTHYGLVGVPVQNTENHLDFTLPTQSGNSYLDLMEVALLEEARGSFDKAKRQYSFGARADAVWSQIARKSEGYGSRPASGIHLLLYSTDFRFDLGQGVSVLLTRMLHARRHCFKSVVYCVPQPDSTAMLQLLYPLSDEARSRMKSEKELRQITAIVFHPGEIVIVDRPSRTNDGK